MIPLTTVVTYLLVPGTATHIFKTFLCDPFEYDTAAGTTRRYLHEDLTLSCASGEYEATRRTAIALIFLWPIGTPLLYLILLQQSRDAIRTRNPTPLSTATALLSADYRPGAYYWEPLEMCRKLALWCVSSKFNHC